MYRTPCGTLSAGRSATALAPHPAAPDTPAIRASIRSGSNTHRYRRLWRMSQAGPARTVIGLLVMLESVAGKPITTPLMLPCLRHAEPHCRGPQLPGPQLPGPQLPGPHCGAPTAGPPAGHPNWPAPVAKHTCATSRRVLARRAGRAGQEGQAHGQSAAAGPRMSPRQSRGPWRHGRNVPPRSRS